jgi:glutamate dehydrogenase (NAD(P)+)
MAWMLDTYLSTVDPQDRGRCMHVVTGKPIGLGGSQGREKATGQGVMYCIEEWARDRAFDLDKSRYIVQGFGNVGSWAARLMDQHGGRLVSAEDVTGAVANPAGIDAEDLTRYARENGGVYGYPKADPVDHETFLATEADIFIPAALENQITGKTASMLRVKLVAEGANGPTDPYGDIMLRKTGIDVLPDILANSGGVIVSYFEWLQNRNSEYWDLDEVDAKLHKIITAAYRRVRGAAREFDVDWRTAAYIVALRRLERCYLERGIFP